MFYAIRVHQTNDEKVLWGFKSKAKRDEVTANPVGGEWIPVTAKEAQEFAINAKRVNLMDVFERPNWLKSAYFRRWNVRRFTNGISVSRPQLDIFYLHSAA